MRDIIDNLARTPLSQVVILVVVLTVIRVVLFPKLMKTPAHMRYGTYTAFKFANELLDAVIYAAVFVFMVIRPFAVQAFLIPSGSMWPTLYVNDFIVVNKAIYRYSNPKEGDIVVFHAPIDAKLSDKDVDSDGTMKLDLIKRCIGVPGDLIELRDGVLYRNGEKVVEPYTHLSQCQEIPESEECANFQDLSDTDKATLTPTSFKLVKYHGELIPLNYDSFDANAARGAGVGTPVYGSNGFYHPPYSVASRFQIATQGEMKAAESLPAEKIPPGYYLMMGDNRNNSYDGRAWGLVPRESIIGRSECIWLPLSRWRITR
jgi:signal peptidase I